MQAAILFKHRQLDKCNKSTERRLQRRDVERAERCGEMESSLEETGDPALTGGGRNHGVGNFLQGGGAGDYIVTCSIPRCPLRSHSLVCSKKHLFIVGIVPIRNKEI